VDVGKGKALAGKSAMPKKGAVRHLGRTVHMAAAGVDRNANRTGGWLGFAFPEGAVAQGSDGN
jgi:hypothetical protein